MTIIFGGSFDPIHNGHISIAKFISHQFQQNVIFMPINDNPPCYKILCASCQHRLTMLRLALADHIHLTIDTTELQQAQYSPTINTIKLLFTKLKLPIYLIMGSDTFATLDTWDDWQQLCTLVNFIIIIRAGYSNIYSKTMLHYCAKHESKSGSINANVTGKVIVIDDVEFPAISSTVIRQHCLTATSINQLVPTAVADFIQHNDLYIH